MEEVAADPIVVADLLWAAWPDECEILGETLVDAIVRGGVKGPEIADTKLDYDSIIATVSAATGLINLWLPWYLANRKASSSDGVAAVRSSAPDLAKAANFSEAQESKLREANSRADDDA